MTANGWFQIFFFFALVLLCAKPVGIYLAHLFERERVWPDRIFRPIERLIYRLTGIDETHEMAWTEYAIVMLVFSLVTMLVTYAIERLQNLLPLNPQHLAAVAPDLALNTAASFTTNTNWQAYVPETTMSYLTQMLTLAYHNFFSGAAGIALAVALIRGISRRESKTLGNFWVDMTRASLWVLLPGCVIYALLLVSQGVVQNFRPYDQAKLVQPQIVKYADRNNTKHCAGTDGVAGSN
jgi:K+-transporting ATPase ATPase A chain